MTTDRLLDPGRGDEDTQYEAGLRPRTLDELIRRLEEGRIDGLPVYHQPAAKPGAKPGKYSWRRTPTN